MNLHELYQSIENLDNFLVGLQKNLVSIPALGPESDGDGELAKSEYIETVLQHIGFDEIFHVDAPDDRVSSGIRPNIIARINGKNREQTVWIMAHMDVVPAGDLRQWDSDPFTLFVDDDKMIGRGVEDNHQGLACALLACKALRDEGVTPDKNIALAIVADEETGSHYGLEYVLKHRSDLFKENDLIIVPDAGDPEGITIEVAEKSIVWLRFIVKGQQCHASTPQAGNNAHKAAVHLAVALQQLYDLYPDLDENYDDPRSTFELTKIENNVPNVNTIPAEHVFYMDCRILPQYALNEVEQSVRKICESIAQKFAVQIEFSYAQKEEAAPPTPADAPVVLALTQAIQDVKDKSAQIVGIGGGTVASFFRKAGLPAVVWGTIEDTCHQPNEYALISNILEDAKVLLHVFMH